MRRDMIARRDHAAVLLVLGLDEVAHHAAVLPLDCGAVPNTSGRRSYLVTIPSVTASMSMAWSAGARRDLRSQCQI